MMPGSREVRCFVERFATLIERHKDELTELDAAIGDADHGINMDRGMKAALQRVGAADSTPEALLRTTAMALISTVGGASGPLYGTAFLRAATAVAGKTELGAPEVAALFRAAAEGIHERGKAAPGEKTMVDAFDPAVVELERAVSEGAELSAGLQRALAAARKGSDETIPLVARKGRASYLGERAIGHRDPGSLSTAILFQAAAETLA